MKGKHIGLGVFLVLLGLGCRPKETPIFPADEEFLSYCYFEAGSYWIYSEDSTPSLLDSVYVIGNSNYVVYVDGQPETAHDQYVCRYITRGQKMDVLVNAIGDDGERMIMHELDTANNFDAIHLFDNAPGDSIDYGNTKITGRFDTLRINGIVYHNVIEVSHRQPASGNPTKEITFAKGVGIIHRRFWDGTSWGLVRYKIN